MSSTPSAVALRGPAELVAAIPYLIGFVPSASVVGVFLRDSRIVLTVRIDADGDVAEGLARAAQASGADEAAVVLFDCVVEVSLPPAVVVRDVISVAEGCWRSLLCSDDTCCPASGNAISQEVRDAVAATFVVDGVAPLADRSALESLFDHAPDADFAELVEIALDDAVVLMGLEPGPLSLRHWREDAADDVCQTLRDCISGEHVDDMARARVVTAMQDIRVRDVVLHRLADFDDLRGVANWLRALAVRTPVSSAAAVYVLCGAAYWQGGDGARACEALEQGLALDPDYSLGTLLYRAIQAGMPPATWRQALRDTSEEDCFTGAA